MKIHPMTAPYETIEIHLTDGTTARIHIQIRDALAIPAPHEPDVLTIPTARQLGEISQLLANGKFVFPR